MSERNPLFERDAPARIACHHRKSRPRFHTMQNAQRLRLPVRSRTNSDCFLSRCCLLRVACCFGSVPSVRSTAPVHTHSLGTGNRLPAPLMGLQDASSRAGTPPPRELCPSSSLVEKNVVPLVVSGGVARCAGGSVRAPAISAHRLGDSTHLREGTAWCPGGRGD